MLRKITHRFKGATQGFLARRARNDDSASMLEMYRESDLVENLETSPPEDERIDMRCLWAVEFYTPSHVDKLLDSLRKLGWDQEDIPRRDSPASWVTSTRLVSQRGGSWLNLGIIRPLNDTSPWPSRDRTAPLPMHVHYARGGLYSLTPSLTCIVMCFVFEESLQSRLEEVLRRDRQTFIKPLRRVRQIFDPETQKREEVRLVRHECVNLAADWFKEQLPGVFCSGLLGDQLPTCELTTLQKAEPFPSLKAEPPPPSYLRILELDFSLDAWKSTDATSLKFAFRTLRENPKYHSVFVVRTTDIDDGQILEAYGGLPGLGTYVDSVYQEMLGKMATGALLDGYNRRLNALRDTITTGIRKSSRRKPFQTLQTLVGDTAYDFDIAAITTDLISSTDESSWFRRHIPRFEPCIDWHHHRDLLADSFCFGVNRQATRLQQADQALRDHLTQYGSLLAATEDIRTQNRILLLTGCVLICTIVTVVATDVGSRLIAWAQGIWKYFQT